MDRQVAIEMAIRAKKELSAMDSTMRKVRRMKQRFAGMAKSMIRNAKKVVAAIRMMKKAFMKLRNAMRTLRNVALRAFTALVALTGIPIKFFADFEQKMANVNTLLDVSEQKFQKLGDGVINISNKIGESATKLSTALYDIVSAGVESSNSLAVLDRSARAAKAGMADTQTAVNAGLGTINAYNLAVQDLSKVYDLQFQTVKQGVITYEELAHAQGQLLPSAKKLNESLENMYGAFSFVTKAGLGAQKASLSLARAYDSLVKKSGSLAEAGVEVYDELGKFRGIAPIIEDLSEQLEGLTDKEMQGVLQDIGFDIRAARAIVPMITNVEGLKESIEGMKGSTGAMDEAFKKATDNIMFRWNRAKENVINAVRSIGASFESEVGNMLDSISTWANAIRNFVDDNKEAIKSVLTFALKLTGTVAVFATVGVALMGLLTPIGAVSAGIMAFGAMWHLNMYDIRGWTEDMWQRVQPILANFWDWLKKAWNWSIETAKDGWKWITDTTWSEKIEDIKEMMTDGWDWGINIIKNGAQFIWDWFEDKAPETAEKLETAWDWSVEAGNDLFNWVHDTAWPWIKDGASTIWKWTVKGANLGKDAAGMAINATIEWAGELYNSIKRGFNTGNWSDALDIGTNVWQTGVSIWASLKLAQMTAVAVITSIKTALQNSKLISAPTSVTGALAFVGMMSIGISLMEAWSEGDYKSFAEDLIGALTAGLLASGLTGGNVQAGILTFTLALNFKLGSKLNALDFAKNEVKFLFGIDDEKNPAHRPGGGGAKATGGLITGPGTGTSDDIPAMLSNGEYVIKAKQTKKFRPLLEAINSGGLPGFNTGGPVAKIDAGRGMASTSGANQLMLEASGLGSNKALQYLAKVSKDTENFKHIVDLVAGFKDMKTEYENQMAELQAQSDNLKDDIKDDLEDIKDGQSEYTATVSDIANQMSSFFNSLENITGSKEAGLLGGLASAGGSAYQSYQNFGNATGMMGKVTAGLGMANAALAAVGAFKSYNEARNAEEKKEWQGQKKLDKEQLDNLKKIQENTQKITNDMVNQLAKNPTVSNVADTKEVMKELYDTLTNDLKPNFGSIAIKVKEDDVMFDDIKTSKYNPTDLLSRLGVDMSQFGLDGSQFTSDNLGKLDIGQLKELNEIVQSISSSELKDMAQNIADGMDVGSGELKSWSSNFDEFKKKLQLYVETVEELGVTLENLTEGVNYEAFTGVEWLSAKDRVDQYRKQLEQLYLSAGKDLDKHQDEIDQKVDEYADKAVDGGKRIITIMQSVRQGFINAFSSGKSAAQSFATGLKSYFDTMKSNIASLFYDIQMDGLDAKFKKYFGEFTDQLANYEGDDVLGFAKSLLQGEDMSALFGDLIDAYKSMGDMSSINDLLIEQFREQAEAAGMTEEQIEEMLESMGLLTEEARKALEQLKKVKGALKDAMSTALEEGTIQNFSKAMGQSIYDNAKQGLIKAFMESKVYQEMFSKWFDESGMEFTGDLETDFANMQDLLAELKEKLKEAGMNIDSTVVPTTGNGAEEGNGLYSNSDSYFAPSTLEAGENMAAKFKEAVLQFKDSASGINDNIISVEDAVNQTKQVLDGTIRRGVGLIVRTIQDNLPGLYRPDLPTKPAYSTESSGTEVTHYHYSPQVENLYGNEKEELFMEFLNWKKSKEDDEA